MKKTLGLLTLLGYGLAHVFLSQPHVSAQSSGGANYTAPIARSALQSVYPIHGRGYSLGLDSITSSSSTGESPSSDAPICATSETEHFEDPADGPQWDSSFCGGCGAYSAVPGRPSDIIVDAQSKPNDGDTGCSDCGSSSSGSRAFAPLNGAMVAGPIYRSFLPNNRVNNSSFGPGVYSQFDSQIDIFSSSGGNTISFFDSIDGRVYLFVDGLDGDTSDGEFHDMRNNHSRKIELLNSSGAVVTSPSSAASAKVTHWSGYVEKFEIIDLNAGSSGPELAGRLKTRVDTLGREVTIDYKSFTTSEIEESPDRQWQIDTISDDQGREMTFSYLSYQQSGRWVVSTVERNFANSTTFSYSDLLTSVSMPGGRQTTYSYEQDTYTQTFGVTIKEAGLGGEYSGRTVTHNLTNDFMLLDVDDVPQVVNQPSGVHRFVMTPSAQVEWMVVPNANPAIDDQFNHVGGNIAKVRNGDGTYHAVPVWGVFAQSPSDPNYEQTDYAAIYGQVATNAAGAASTTTTAQLRTGRWPGLIDQEGREKSFTYDSDGNATVITNEVDSTVENRTYNSKGQVTRVRKRDGSVEKFTFDSAGNVTAIETGIVEQGGSDVQTSQYGVVTKEYYGSTHANAGLLKAEMSPLYNSSSPTLHRTDYEYDSNNRLTKKIGPAVSSGQSRPEWTYTYNSAGLLYQETNPEGHTITHTYDSSGSLTQKSYADSTTEQTLYGTDPFGNTGKVLKTKDRMGVVTTYEYDGSGRLSKTTQNAAQDANILDGNADDTTITDSNLKVVTQYSYLLNSSNLRSQVKVNGVATDYVYDSDNRLTETKQYPRSGVTLSSKKVYLGDLLFYDEDPQGRRKYYGYRASDRTLIRTITCTVPEHSFADFEEVWDATRNTSANALYVIHDAIRDDVGRLTQVIDGRGTETRYEYDGQGRETTKKSAYGTSIEARTDTLYDAAGNVTEVRHPRYFDSADTEGYQKAKETWTYNGRGLVASHTDATGSSIAATESFTYDLGGHQATRTDFGGNVWTRYEDSCCEKKTANADPLGHGTIVNTDSNGRTVHTIQVSDVSTHVGSFSNPTDAKTLSESTTKFDGRGRVIYQTTWLSARGTVDPANPPIAGIGGVSLSDGLTTQYLYDDNLADGVGLDNSTGVSVSKLGTGGSGTFNVSLSNAISKLASTEANGGANVTFSSTAPGKATVVISPEDEISFTISDAAGRSVMSGKLNNYRGSGSTALNTLATWNCTVYDATTSLSGYGTVLVTKSVDPQGNTTASWTDAAGRTLRSIDQLGKVTTMTFDAAGNQLSVRDPNNVGADMLYDALGRNTQRTDTNSAVTKTEYDKSGNAIKQTDAKNKHTYITFDARGRRKSTTDRISAVTSFTYTALGQLASLTDAESQTTSYTYDSRGSKLTETYPDHTSGTSPGQTGYGIVTFVYDNAGRVKRKQDQLGDTVTYTFDLAGRMTTKDYRTAANSPTGTIADSDTFTFDRAGRMLTAASGRYSNTVTYTFDPIGRKATEALTIGGQTYTITSEYNSRGELTKVTYPDSSISERTYHATGALNQLKLDGSTISTRTYDDGRRLTGETLGNGVTESRTYASDNLLTAISYGGTGTSIGNLSYTWDSNKNKTSETIGGTMSNYGFTSAGTSYDDEDRLTGFARASGTFTQSWSLTSVGDWNSITTNGTAQNRTHGPTHELLTAGGQNVTTDVKGNITLLPTTLTTSGVAMAVGYDFDNKLKSADVDNNGSNDVTFQYDALGRRVARQGTSGSFVYVQQDQQTIADYGYGDAPSSPTHRYVYASYIDEPVVRKAAGTSGTIHYYHRNQQYSITAVTTSSGSVVERYAYTAYGQPTILDGSGSVLSSSAINNRYTYTGREWDQTLGLYHFRARWMSGLAGRFMGRDPVGYADGFGLYFSYLNLSSMDPEGESVHSCSVSQASLNGGLRMMGENLSFGTLVDRIKKILNTTIKFDIYWDFQVSGSFRQSDCVEDCECSRTASFQQREFSAKGNVLLGLSVPVGALASISGDIRFTADLKGKGSSGGCNGVSNTKLCGSLSGGGQIKACLGRKLFGEACVVAKVSCEVFGKCETGIGSGHSQTQGRCTASLSGSACIANGLFCGESDIGNIKFNLPFAS